jgi:hypothetical protein
MNPNVFSAFADELTKLSAPSAASLIRTPGAAFKALDRAGQLAGATGAAVSKGVPRVGKFGISVKTATKDVDGREYEEMDRPAWKQTAKDLPLVVGATALGYGLGKTLSEEVGRRYVASGKIAPKWLQYAPVVHAGLMSGSSYLFGRSRAALKDRRDDARAREAAKVGK